MKFTRKGIRDYYLYDTPLENIFINDYLPMAQGDYVKVYIYGVMYASFGMTISNQVMSQQLGLSEKVIEEAWNYWEDLGCIRKIYRDGTGQVDFTVEFLNLKEEMYGKVEVPAVMQEEEPEVNIFGNEQVKKMFESIEQMLGRTLSSTEIGEILSWVADEHDPVEVILFAFRYCLDKNKSSIRYIQRVVENWRQQGLRTEAQVEAFLQERDQRYYQYKRVLDALGFKRNATEAEKTMMDQWFDQMNLNMDTVLNACAKTVVIPNPNFKYVNAILENWYGKSQERGTDANESATTVSRKTLNAYYEFLREKASREADERVQEVYRAVPEIQKVDHQMMSIRSDITRNMLSGDSQKTEQLKQQLEDMMMDKMILLTENNFQRDYMEVKYSCSLCNDTGITDSGEQCECVARQFGNAAVWEQQMKAGNHE